MKDFKYSCGTVRDSHERLAGWQVQKLCSTLSELERDLSFHLCLGRLVSLPEGKKSAREGRPILFLPWRTSSFSNVNGKALELLRMRQEMQMVHYL